MPTAVIFYMDAGAGDSSAVPCSRPHPRCYTVALKGLDIPRNMNLDDDGNCYIADGLGCYARVDFDLELANLEECLKGMHATLETPYDQIFVARKREVLRQQGISLLTIKVEPEDVMIH